MPNYDLVVVGAGLGGLAAASLGSRLNKKTLVLEPGKAVGGALASLEKDHFVFYPGPLLSFGFERGETLQQLNETLGISQDTSLRSPCYQVALPDRRITVYAEQAETLEELRREFPNEIDKIEKFYRDLHRQSLRNSKSRFSAFLANTTSARGFISSYGFSREFTAFLDVQSLYFFNCRAADLRQLSLIQLCDSAPLTLPRGFSLIAGQMLDVVLKNGGDIRYNVSFQDISLKKNKLYISEEIIETGTVLINPESGPPMPFTCCGLREEVVPVGMLNDVLCVTDYAHPENFVSLSLSTKGDQAAAPPGMRTLIASSRSFSHQSLDERVHQMKMIIPFLTEFLLFAHDNVPMTRTFVMPNDISMKKVKKSDGQTLLSRDARKGIYMLVDRVDAPVLSVSAAQRFMEFIN